MLPANTKKQAKVSSNPQSTWRRAFRSRTASTPTTTAVDAHPVSYTHLLDEQTKHIIAYHESGHALVGHLLPHADPVHKISIISRGRALGYTLSIPKRCV